MIKLFRAILPIARSGHRTPWVLLCPGSFCHASSSDVDARRWRFRLVALLLVWLPVQAAESYNFPNNLPPGCSGNNDIYSCGELTLAADDVITVNSPTTITVGGNFTTGAGSKINEGGSAADLTLVVNGMTDLGAGTFLTGNLSGSGTVTTGAQSDIRGNITTIAGVVNIGNNNTVFGKITTDSAAINVGDHSSVTGAITTTVAGVVTVGANSTIVGNIKTASGAVNIGDSSTVDGSIISGIAGAITLGNHVKVTGDVATTYHGSEVGAGAITIGSNSEIGGNVTTKDGAITVGNTTEVGGGLGTDAGAITVGNATDVTGSVCTGKAGAITVGRNTDVGGNLVTNAGAISVGSASNIDGALIFNGAGARTVAHNATVGTTPNSSECPKSPSSSAPLKIISRQWRQLFMR